MGRGIILNLLDATPSPHPFSQDHLNLLRDYVRAFFGEELIVVQTPKTHVSPPGALAMSEKVRRILHVRRTGKKGKKDSIGYSIPDLFECLKVQRDKGCGSESIGPFDCLAVLAVTSDELYHDDKDLKPGKMLPRELLTPYSYSCPKLKIGVCTTANLRPPMYRPTTNLNRFADNTGVVKTELDRVLLRNLFKLITHEICRMLEMKKCDLHRCLCYKQPFKGDTWGIFLCANCDSELIVLMAKKEKRDMEQLALKRLVDLTKVFQDAQASIGAPLRFGHRDHGEFEKEIDWLYHAAHNLSIKLTERKHFTLRSTGAPVTRKRSIGNIIRTVHREAPKLEYTRTLSLPDLKRHCLLDMTLPVMRDVAPLGSWKGEGWPDKVINAHHSTGGHYVELGGSLRPKDGGGFWFGINSSILKRIGDSA